VFVLSLTSGMNFMKYYILVAAHKLGITDKTAEKHIKGFSVSGLVNHFAHDKDK
jgi:hypothetical protein